MTIIRTLAKFHRHEIDKIKGSRFIASIQPAANLHEITHFLETCRDQFRAANHNCFAWRLAGSDQFRYSDDGEPSGTAGRPILQEIDGRELVDVAVVVTRYFGGTKLGTGGLIRAYGRAAAEALELAEIVEHVVVVPVIARFDYRVTGPVQGVLSAFELVPSRSDYGAEVLLELAVPEEQEPAVRAALVDATHGNIRFEDKPITP